jgi:uncharacterized protein YdcH (DUF465 family)
MYNEVLKWLQSGANTELGIKLLEKYSTNTLLIRLVKANPVKNGKLLKDSLCKLAGVVDVKTDGRPSQQPDPVPRDTFRQEFTFLENPDCPYELKALVTDKFSSYHRYRKLHAELFDCTSLEQCGQIARDLLFSYRENREIYAELNYYKQHKTILGKHPIFKHFHRLKELKGMSLRELIKKEEKLQHNIWRIESEIAKGDKPALLDERQQRLELKKNELSEVKRLLD